MVITTASATETPPFSVILLLLLLLLLRRLLQSAHRNILLYSASSLLKCQRASRGRREARAGRGALWRRRCSSGDGGEGRGEREGDREGRGEELNDILNISSPFLNFSARKGRPPLTLTKGICLMRLMRPRR